MAEIKKYANRIEAFLQSEAGQRFFNIAFSLGAAIVIWGALFMILNVPGGRTLLCIGMGTEILMFILTAFDRPPKEPEWRDVTREMNDKNSTEYLDSITIVDDSGKKSRYIPSKDIQNDSRQNEVTCQFLDAVEKVTLQLNQLQETMATGNLGYSHQIAELNRNIAGLNSLYELQLKNVSGQLTSMTGLNEGLKGMKEMYEKSASDSAQYCEETEKMTQYMKQINAVYAKMISAMQVNS